MLNLNNFHYREYKKSNKSSLLMKKYQGLIELYKNMTKETINERPQRCQLIFDDKQNYFLNIFEVKKELKEFHENCDQMYKNSYTFKLMENFSLKLY